MDSETILKTLHNRLQVHRYANNAIKSYCGYALSYRAWLLASPVLYSTTLHHIGFVCLYKEFFSKHKTGIGLLTKPKERINSVELHFVR